MMAVDVLCFVHNKAPKKKITFYYSKYIEDKT
jgi:hypothetical protein